ncbi:MAG TPA: hypothetical protein VGH54_09535 [Mycobacterium sp.]|jgi:hypothetical protein|uniref:hypothetical protein n=1 Tax=Mycobacterium sp. TaxID=1785 RepID=UPI002F40BB32
MAYDVGDIAISTLTVAPFDGTTGATAVVRAPDGTETTPTPVSADGGATWTVQTPISVPGVWYVTWTTTGTGAGSQVDTFEAEPPPPPTPEQRQVRLLISDTDPGNRFFSTSEIEDFLTLNAQSVRRSAAQALDTIASNEAMVSKKIRTQDLQTDGPAVAAALRAQATELRRQADDGEEGTDTGFEIAEYEPYPHRPGWWF